MGNLSGADTNVLMDGFGRAMGDLRLFGRFAREEGVIVRFIEFMPLEAGDLWSRDMLVPGAEIRDTLNAWMSLVPVDPNHDAETAERFRFADGVGEIDIIGGAWDAKEEGHLINSKDFVRPERTMSAIGG